MSTFVSEPHDKDPVETKEWVESIDSVISGDGRERGAEHGGRRVVELQILRP